MHPQQVTPAGGTDRLWNVPLAPMPSALARARSCVVREVAAGLLPRSILFARGARHSERKRIALTFDDGPDAMTPRYLEVLERLGARATFFVIGQNVARDRTAVNEYLRYGHEVGGHGWSHEPFASMNRAQLTEELSRTEALLPARRVPRALVRPPRGSLSGRALMRLASAGYVAVLWSLDSDDCRTRDPRAIERRLTPRRVTAGDVVLMHEMQPWTLDALPGVVRALHGAGYETVTVSELMKGDESAS